MYFTYSPTPEVLNWLAKGRLADKQLRSIRLWVILSLLYGTSQQSERLPQPFRYADVRDRLFATTHGNSETAKFAELSAACVKAASSTSTSPCLCQQSLATLLSQSALPYSIQTWQQEIVSLTSISAQQLKSLLSQSPFATVHRSIRADLTYLADLDWLKSEGKGRYRTLPASDWPQMPSAQPMSTGTLSVAQTWEVVRSLESISFVQPGLHVIIQSLWEQLTAAHQSVQTPTKPTPLEPERRIFIHLDYILTDTLQDHVDTLQEQIEQLWREDSRPDISTNPNSSVIQFD